MAIYEYKEFLTIDEVAEYLTDKGVYYSHGDPCRHLKLKSLIIGLINENKLQAVFSYFGYVIDLGNDWLDYTHSLEFDPREPHSFPHHQKPYKGFFIASQSMLNDWQNCNAIHYTASTYDKEHGYYQSCDLCGYQNFKNQSYYALTSLPKLISIDFYFPKCQLDAIFNPSQSNLTDLQQENERLQARIAELKQQLTTPSENGTPATMELSHTNTALTALFDVINTHWQNPNQPPKQEFIKSWILDKYPSLDPSKALWIDKIIRHQDQK